MADSEPPSHGPTFTAFITTCNIAPIPPYIPLYLAMSPDHLCIPPSLSIYHCVANPPVLFNFLSITLSSLWCLHLEVRQWRALKWERRVIEGEEVLGQRKTGISCSQIGGKRHELCFCGSNRRSEEEEVYPLAYFKFFHPDWNDQSETASCLWHWHSLFSQHQLEFIDS